MSSAIEGIYRSIANLELGGLQARNLEVVSLEVEAADLPLRLLLPSTFDDGTFPFIGTLNRLSWSIRDLCLWALIDTEIKDLAAPMLRYMVACIDAYKTIEGPTSQSHITGYKSSMGPILWGETWYWAVDNTLTIEEVL